MALHAWRPFCTSSSGADRSRWECDLLLYYSKRSLSSVRFFSQKFRSGGLTNILISVRGGLVIPMYTTFSVADIFLKATNWLPTCKIQNIIATQNPSPHLLFHIENKILANWDSNIRISIDVYFQFAFGVATFRRCARAFL